jgi:hypothetical protein
LLLLILVMVTFAPVALRPAVTVALLPTLTPPKLIVAGLTESCPVSDVPVATRSATVAEGCASLAKVNVALAAPLDCGLKATPKGAL